MASAFPPVPETEFVVYGTITAHPEKADEAAKIIRKVSDVAATEEGILYYCITRDAEVRHKFHVFERYAGRKAFEDHGKQEGLQELLGSGVVAEFAPVILKL
ncbi:hypothetical protein LTR10_002234 [Elasticomyces elasticus]|uniref:ABM domain-containing protein n=1 Tax=Elasticomyces elasticus TaxID=574655 RepID=A0AAN7WDE0_9PEZI|nr:hypothetical protein LTR10_002234 [Elasticomyces elasticus]KAK4973692.1 hypothetical protein LTR42_005681 [Elasticomyces elasticus]KAK5707801.1 hypothetical protein LTR97_000339 [Elasticomyces elasticus]KAK5727222.1 hypothetical protein LTR15_003116 [Elasticomyces elasticus]